MEYMLRDKKKVQGSLKFILPDRIGHAIITAEINQNIIDSVVNETILEG